jgi:peptidoglycan/xylan/chitin deacetylase (PgdA/CDA1 family)
MRIEGRRAKRAVVSWALVALAGCASSSDRPPAAPPPRAPQATLSGQAHAPEVLASTLVAPERSEPESAPIEGGPNEAGPLGVGPLTAVYDGWTTNEPLVPHEETRVIVLMYHAIDHGTESKGISPKVLDAQLRYLEENHFAFAPMHELLRFLDRERELPRHVAVLTIDDGELTFYDNGFPVFLAHHAPFVLGLPTAAIEESDRRKVTMSWDKVREIMASGLCEVASHGHTHRALGNLPIHLVRFEAERPRDLIEQKLGFRPETFFFPMGSANAGARAEVERAGYRAAFGAVGARITDTTPRFMIPRFGVTRDTTPYVMTRLLHGAGIELKPSSHW